MSSGDVSTGTTADDVAQSVLAVPGVAALHGGMFGEVGTYLPGRRVLGVRLRDDSTDVHVSVLLGYPVRQIADQVRRAVGQVVPGPVHVVVEDVVERAPG